MSRGVNIDSSGSAATLRPMGLAGPWRDQDLLTICCAEIRTLLTQIANLERCLFPNKISNKKLNKKWWSFFILAVGIKWSIAGYNKIQSIQISSQINIVWWAFVQGEKKRQQKRDKQKQWQL